MSKIEDRLAALEAENARLNAELAALKPKPIVLPRGASLVEERGVSIRNPPPGFCFAMPTDDELARLRAIVIAAYAGLEYSVGRLDRFGPSPFDSFKAAFEGIGRLGRTPEPVDGVSLDFYIGLINHELKISTELTGQAFLAAMLAHGDIPFRPLGQSQFGHLPTFGLAHHVNTGRPATGEGWRAVLAAGAVPQPTHGVRQVPNWSPAVSQVRSW